MSRGLTRKHDFEKGKRNSAAQNPDYRDRFQDEGDHFAHGGLSEPSLLRLRGRTVWLDRRPLWSDDKHSLIQTLERHTTFVLGDQVGTIGRLRKQPGLATIVDERFEFMRRSILRADEIVGVAKHPTKNRQYYVVEFKSCLRPAQPMITPIFKRHLAFAMKLVGPALTKP